ncbi:MAG: hypothetical protein NTX86_00460 [Candidatus Dependentiae bacterium]|nr:hypothetical protein [Candidatus Dependentiae bacterium]
MKSLKKLLLAIITGALMLSGLHLGAMSKTKTKNHATKTNKVAQKKVAPQPSAQQKKEDAVLATALAASLKLEQAQQKNLQNQEKEELTKALEQSRLEALTKSASHKNNANSNASMASTEEEYKAKAEASEFQGLEEALEASLKESGQNRMHGETLCQGLNFTKQIEVPQQKGSSCGYHAMSYVRAIQVLHATQQELTKDTIVKEAQEMADLIQLTDIGYDQIIAYNNQYKLFDGSNVYIVDYDQKTKKAVFLCDLNDNGLTGKTKAKELQNRLEAIKNKQEAYFICNTGGHWVMAAYVDGEIIYIDSMNQALSSDGKTPLIGNIAYNILSELTELIGLNN